MKGFFQRTLERADLSSQFPLFCVPMTREFDHRPMGLSHRYPCSECLLTLEEEGNSSLPARHILIIEDASRYRLTLLVDILYER